MMAAAAVARRAAWTLWGWGALPAMRVALPRPTPLRLPPALNDALRTAPNEVHVALSRSHLFVAVPATDGAPSGGSSDVWTTGTTPARVSPLGSADWA